MGLNFKLKLDDFTFQIKSKTRWRDLDAFRHVNNATFLTYIEDARITFFKRWNLKSKKKSLIIGSVKIDYLIPIKHPSKLIIGSKISRIGNCSFDVQSAIFIETIKNPSAFSCVTCVCYDYENSKSVSVYDEIRKDY